MNIFVLFIKLTVICLFNPQRRLISILDFNIHTHEILVEFEETIIIIFLAHPTEILLTLKSFKFDPKLPLKN